MTKTKVVIFDNDGYARIFTNPSDEVMKLPGAFINPDLSKVTNVSPEYWKLDNNEIVPMTISEMYERDKDLASETVQSNIIVLEKAVEKIIKVVPKWTFYVMGIETIIILILLMEKM